MPPSLFFKKKKKKKSNKDKIAVRCQCGEVQRFPQSFCLLLQVSKGFHKEHDLDSPFLNQRRLYIVKLNQQSRKMEEIGGNANPLQYPHRPSSGDQHKQFGIFEVRRTREHNKDQKSEETLLRRKKKRKKIQRQWEEEERKYGLKKRR